MESVPVTGRHWRTFFFNLSLVILLAVSGLYTGLALSTGRAIEAEITTRARTIYGAVVLARRWNAMHGGVYVEKRPGQESSPWLEAPERLGADGTVYVQLGQALMTRELSQLTDADGAFRFRLTSLKPLKPANAPDAFEAAALARLERGEAEVSERERRGDAIVFRYLGPLRVEPSCLGVPRHPGLPGRPGPRRHQRDLRRHRGGERRRSGALDRDRALRLHHGGAAAGAGRAGLGPAPAAQRRRGAHRRDGDHRRADRPAQPALHRPAARRGAGPVAAQRPPLRLHPLRHRLLQAGQRQPRPRRRRRRAARGGRGGPRRAARVGPAGALGRRGVPGRAARRPTWRAPGSSPSGCARPSRRCGSSSRGRASPSRPASAWSTRSRATDPDARDAERMVARADEALYRAKAAGRNRVEVG